MSEQGRCSDCGGTNGKHFNDCSYDGTSGGRKSSNNSIFKWILIVFLILLFGALVGFSSEVLGVIFAFPILFLFAGLFAWMFK